MHAPLWTSCISTSLVMASQFRCKKQLHVSKAYITAMICKQYADTVPVTLTMAVVDSWSM